MGIIALITGVVGIIAILLRDYIPGWRKKHDTSNKQDEVEAFGETLVSGTDVDVSTALSAEYDRVRTGKSGDTSK